MFRWSFAVLLTSQHENSDFPSRTKNSWEWAGCSLSYSKHKASLCKSHCQIPDIDLIYRPDFLLEIITQLIANWLKIKHIMNKIFDDLLVKIMFSYVMAKILFIEYKYFGLNVNIFCWMQVYFLKYQIFFIKDKYFFIKCKYIKLNANVFSKISNIFHWIQIFFIKYKYIFIEYIYLNVKYFSLNIKIISLNVKLTFFLQISNRKIIR